ncbi:arginyl-tRNA--protein transferase 1-like [Metopolophium dirhodum]|uniref:arginyl-tRNA--protein transferase 1-like n=1 Tax=Metopolophium dirhodum TaxID=44670 RepID=UPI0029900F81|nr:arginyl-tRNA--protein transferase 1-like [Metopolophium dirhodum]XP_060864907.1 arginyl-tRNA--protein transferase 1-like [Metopolophium dirhodum]
MTKYFNVDIDNIITDYELAYQNAKENFIDEIKRTDDNILKVYTQDIDEYSKTLKNLSDVNNKISKGRDTLQHISDKVKCEQQILQTESDRLESINNECNSLGATEIELNDVINKTKEQLTQVYKEKKTSLKKLKREINSFRTGVNMYERFLQLNMNIESNEINTIINITMKNVKNHSDYKVIFEENENNFKLIDIIPRSQTVMKAATLYDQNKDIQGLLAFLYTI